MQSLSPKQFERGARLGGRRVRLEKTGDNDRRQCADAPAKGRRGRAGLLKPPDSRHLIREAPPIVRGPSIASVGDIRCRRDRPRRCRGPRQGSKRRSTKRSWAPRKEPKSSARMAWAPAWERRAWERRAWARGAWARRAWERRTWERRACAARPCAWPSWRPISALRSSWRQLSSFSSPARPFCPFWSSWSSTLLSSP